jgi:hypothetical protein
MLRLKPLWQPAMLICLSSEPNFQDVDRILRQSLCAEIAVHAAVQRDAR